MFYRPLLTAFIVLLAVPLCATTVDPDSALKILEQGNQRFVDDAKSIEYTAKERREALQEDHEPIAAILCCSDARVPTELIFDQDVGKLFVVRLAGNIAGPLAVESLEFAVDHLKTPLIVVMGHEDCGAVQSTIDLGPNYEGPLSGIINMIEPAVEMAEKSVGTSNPKKLLNTAIQENVRLSAANIIRQNPAIASAFDQGKIRIVLAEFHLDSGRVEWLKDFQTEEQRN